MRAVIEQIETCELKATEWRVAMRLLHQADPQGKVVLSREACVALCQVHVWGAAARILCRLAGHGLIGWYSDRQGVYVYFPGWRPVAPAAGEHEAQDAFRGLHAVDMDSKAGGTPANPALQGAQLEGMSELHLLLQAMTDLTRQNGALLGVLADLARQIGALMCALAKGDAPIAALGADETRQNGASDEVIEQLRAELVRETRQNGALRSHLASTARATEGGLPHAYASAHVGADGLSVSLLDPRVADLQTDRPTGLAVGDGLREGARLATEGEVVKADSPHGPARPGGSSAVESGIEPELALGLLTSREVGLPLRDAEAVAYVHPFWRIRDCVFYFLNQRVAKRFRSPRIMLTWLTNWDQWVVPATDEADAETALYQRYLLPAERQARSEDTGEEGARLQGVEEGGDWEQGAEGKGLGAGSQGQGANETEGLQVDTAGVATVVSEHVAMWQRVLGDLALQMPAAAYDTWVRDTWLSGVERDPSVEEAEMGDEAWVIGVANAYAVDWLRHRLHGKIERAIRTVVGRAVRVEFAVSPRPVMR